MNSETIVGAHKGIIYLFIAILIIKVAMLLINKRFFEAVREKFKLTEIILGPLVLISGIYLVYLGGWNFPTWLIVKTILILLAIPSAVIGLKKGNRPLALISLLLFLTIFFFMVTKRNHRLFESVEIKYSPIQQESISINTIRFDRIDCSRIHGKHMLITTPNPCPVENNKIRFQEISQHEGQEKILHYLNQGNL